MATRNTLPDRLIATALHNIPGVYDTLWELEGIDADGHTYVFYADHRPAWAICEAINAGYEPEVDIPSWMFGYRIG